MSNDKPKHPGGRPRIWKSPQALEKAVDEYFAQEGKKSVCGLCLALDCDHVTLLNYAKRDEFFTVVTRAKRRIMRYYEELGQEVRQGMFPDRMLTRMLWPAVEKQEIDARVQSVADLMAALGSDDDESDESERV